MFIQHSKTENHYSIYEYAQHVSLSKIYVGCPSHPFHALQIGYKLCFIVIVSIRLSNDSILLKLCYLYQCPLKIIIFHMSLPMTQKFRRQLSLFIYLVPINKKAIILDNFPFTRLVCTTLDISSRINIVQNDIKKNYATQLDCIITNSMQYVTQSTCTGRFFLYGALTHYINK